MKVKHALFTTLFLMLAVLSNIATVFGLYSWSVNFLVLTVVSVSYNIFEVSNLRRKSGSLWAASPVVLCSGYLFIVFFGVSNIGYFVFDDFIGSVKSININQMKWSSETMNLVFAASVGMWMGYKSRISRIVQNRVYNSTLLNKFIKKETTPKWWFIIFLSVISVIGYLLAFRLQIATWYGEGSYVALAPYTFYIGMMRDSSYLLVIVLSLYHYKYGKYWSKLALVLLLSIMISYGLYSAAKINVVFPVAALMGGAYIGKGGWDESISYMLVLLVTLLVVSFLVITPVRSYYFQTTQQGGLSFEEWTSAVSKATTGNFPGSPYGSVHDLSKDILSRLHFTGKAARMKKYGDTQSEDADLPNIKYGILISPAYALIPRLLWQNKPRANIGRWSYRAVTGRPHARNAMGTTSIIALYYAGGIIACFLGFFVLGISQRFANTLIYMGAGGIIIYFVLVTSLVRIPSTYYHFIVRIIRLFPIALVVQYFIFRK